MSKPTVFISYSRADTFGSFIKSKLVVLLYRPLLSKGYTLFVDDTVLLPGDGITQEIELAIDSTEIAILLMNPQFLHSDYIQEIEYPALLRRHRSGNARLVPILLESCLWREDVNLREKLFANDTNHPLLESRENTSGLSEILGNIANAVIDLVPAVTSPLSESEASPNPAARAHSSVSGAPPIRGELVDVPQLPRVHLPRPDDESVIRRFFENSSEFPGAHGPSCMVIVGEGGVGKSVLAASIARQEWSRDTFNDGVYWLALGVNADIETLQGQLGKMLGGAPPFRNRREGHAWLSSRLADSKTLLILDDIWAADQLQALLVTGRNGRTLVTARRASNLASLGVTHHELRAHRGDEARELLAAWAQLPSSRSLPSEANAIIDAAGGVALALSLLGCAMRSGEDWTAVASRLRTGAFGDHPYANTFKAVSLATAVLNPTTRRLLYHLAVFPAGVEIPVSTIFQWWSSLGVASPEQALTSLDHLVTAELIDSDAERQSLRLHDLVHDFLRYASDQPMQMLQGEFVDSYLSLLPPASSLLDLPLDTPYIWFHMAYHLRASGRFISPVVTRYEYLVKRIWVGGVRSAESDLALASGEEHRLADIAGSLRLRLARLGHLLANSDSIDSLSQTCSLWLDVASGQRGNLPSAAITSSGPHLLLAPALPLAGALESQLRVLERHDGWVLDLAVSGDDQTLVTGGSDGRLCVWSVLRGDLLVDIKVAASAIRSIAIVPDKHQVIAADSDGFLSLVEWEPPRVSSRVVAHDGGVRSVAFSVNQRLISAGDDGLVRSWSIGDRINPIAQVPAHVGAVLAVASSSTEEWTASGGDDGKIALWSATNQSEVRAFHAHSGAVLSLAVSSDSRHLASSGDDLTVRIWDMPAMTSAYTATCVNPIRSLSFSADGRFLVASGEDGKLDVLDVNGLGSIRRLGGHTDWVRKSTHSRTGAILASCGDDGTARVWDASRVEMETSSLVHGGWVREAVYSSDGRFLVSVSDDGLARVWRPATGRLVRTFSVGAARALCTAMSQDDRSVAVGDSNGLIHVWRISDGELVAVLKQHTDWVRRVKFTRSADQLVSVSDDGLACIWDLSGNRVIRLLDHQNSRVRGLGLSEDGAVAVTGSSDGICRIWDLSSGNELGTLDCMGARVRSISVRRDGSEVLTAGDDGNVNRWSVYDRTKMDTYEASGRKVRSVAFSPDEGLIASADSAGYLKVWRTQSSERLVSVRLGRSLRDVVFSPSGDEIAVSGDDGCNVLRLSSRQPIRAVE